MNALKYKPNSLPPSPPHYFPAPAVVKSECNKITMWRCPSCFNEYVIDEVEKCTKCNFKITMCQDLSKIIFIKDENTPLLGKRSRISDYSSERIETPKQVLMIEPSIIRN